MSKFFPAGVEYTMSKKSDGAMNFVGHEFFDDERRANRATFFKWRCGIEANQTVVPKLNHGCVVEVVEKYNPRWEDVQADAIVTARKGLALTMTAGDCPPVAIYDPVHGVIALIHGSWRSLAAGIVALTLRKMQDAYNVDSMNCLAYIGPGICKNDYDVGWEVAKEFGYTLSPTEKMWLSLQEEITKDLLGCGVNKMNIQATTDCTSHTEIDGKPQYFSWRREKTDPLACQMAVLIMR